ncbi:MAG: hypothetical protein ACRC8S_20930 [Fimbriiglobus sp.]
MRWILAFGLMAVSWPAWGAEAAERLPYQWRVVFHFEPNPIFTASFRQQLLNDTQAALQPTLGELGRVEVVDIGTWAEKSALGKAYLETGFAALEAPAFRELTGIKTHFVKLRIQAGVIRIEARQHDGDTGLSLPVIRQTETRDPQTLNRLVGLMIAKDFGPVATVDVPEKEAEFVKIRFRAGMLPGAERLAKAGDVFIVSEIFEQKRPEVPGANLRNSKNAPVLPPLLVARPREYTLLRLERGIENGVGTCRVLTRFQNAFSVGRVRSAVRAMKLTTVEMTVALRIVDQQTGQMPAANSLLQVRASDIDFLPQATSRDRLDFSNGFFRSGRPLKNVACVIVTLGPGKEERFPVPLMEGRPVNLRFTIDPKSVARADFLARFEVFQSQLMNVVQTQMTLAKDLRGLIVTGKNPQALERAVEGLAALAAQDPPLDAAMAKLKTDPLASEEAVAKMLTTVEADIKKLRDARSEIQDKVEPLRKAVDLKKTDTASFEKEFAAKEMQLSIRRHIEAGEIPEALEWYDRLFDFLKQDSVKEQKAKLETEWKPKNEAQSKARDFLRKTWRELSALDEFQRNLEGLQSAAKTMTENDDRLGLRLLLTSLDQTYARLKELLERLDPQSPTDAVSLQELRDFTQEIRKIEDSARDKVRSIEKTR